MTENPTGDLIQRRGYDWRAQAKKLKLAYTSEFLDALKEELPHFKIVLDLMDLVEKGYSENSQNSTIVRDGIRVTGFSLSNDSGPRRKGEMGYRVDFENKSFFVKRQNDSRLYQGGIHEIMHGQEAKKILGETRGVRVVDYQFGYSSGKKNYLVAEWLGFPRLEEWLSKASKMDEIKKNEVLKRAQEIEQKLRVDNFFDVKPHNMFYDEENDVIIVFDVSKFSN